MNDGMFGMKNNNGALCIGYGYNIYLAYKPKPVAPVAHSC